MLVRAFAFKRWADERTMDAAGRIDPEAHCDALAFVRQQLNHMIIVQDLFRSRLLGESAPHSSTNTDSVPELDQLASWLAMSNDWYTGFVAALERVDDEIQFVFADGKPGAMTVEEILFHLLTHGSYHRGNIAHALDLAGVPHPADGYGIYIHEREPRRREA